MKSMAGAMQSLFYSGLIAFPSATVQDKTKLEPLIDDMLVFPWAKQQDALIALWIANGECKNSTFFSVDLTKVVSRRNIPPIIRDRMFTRNK